jgi:hypothetical protein
MANVDIKPSGLVTSDLVDVLYMWWSSLKGICAKLDDDGGVTSTDYEANVITAILNGSISDTRGNNIINAVTAKADRFYIISPEGYTKEAILECFYDMLDAAETLAEQLDGDSLTFTNYEATAYTAICTQLVENQRGNVLGNGTAVHKFSPGGLWDEKEIVEFLYNAVEFIHLLTSDETTSGLDGDGTVTDTNYEALWYTANITRVIENSASSTIGNARLF